MKTSTYWNVLVHVTAAIMILISSPAIVGLFLAKTLDVLCTFWLDAYAENPLSKFLIEKRNQALKDETPKTEVED